MCSRTRSISGARPTCSIDAGAQARGVVAGIGAEDADGAGGGRTEAHEKPDGGGFAGSIGAEEGDNFAAAEGDGDFVEGDDTVGKPLGDVVE